MAPPLPSVLQGYLACHQQAPHVSGRKPIFWSSCCLSLWGGKKTNPHLTLLNKNKPSQVVLLNACGKSALTLKTFFHCLLSCKRREKNARVLAMGFILKLTVSAQEMGGDGDSIVCTRGALVCFSSLKKVICFCHFLNLSLLWLCMFAR